MTKGIKIKQLVFLAEKICKMAVVDIVGGVKEPDMKTRSGPRFCGGSSDWFKRPLYTCTMPLRVSICWTLNSGSESTMAPSFSRAGQPPAIRSAGPGMMTVGIPPV